jgi:hypothetical protein
MSFKIRDQNFKKMKTWWPNLHLSLFDIKRWNGKESMRFLWGDIDQTRKLHLISPRGMLFAKNWWGYEAKFIFI